MGHLADGSFVARTLFSADHSRRLVRRGRAAQYSLLDTGRRRFFGGGHCWRRTARRRPRKRPAVIAERAMTTRNTPEEGPTVQAFGALTPVRIGLSEAVRHHGVAALNRLLAHTTALRDLYKKAHW